MKKKILALFLTLASTQVMAENNYEILKQMGYTQEYIFQNTPVESMDKNLRTPPKIKEKREKYVPPVEDFIKARIYGAGESSGMIPLLLKLQKKNPTSLKLPKKLAITCYKAGQFKEALYWYTQTYLRDRSDVESLWNMASIAHQLGMNSEARKYLEEYTKVDPNSAWGRMAREFLENNYSNNLKDGFNNENARGGYVEKGSNDSESGILVVEGKRTTVEDFVAGYHESAPSEPVNLNPSPKKLVKKKTISLKKNVARKIQKAGTLGKAKIKKSELPIVKAKPLQ